MDKTYKEFFLEWITRGDEDMMRYDQRKIKTHILSWARVNKHIRRAFMVFCQMFRDHPWWGNSAFAIKKVWRVNKEVGYDIYFGCMHWEGGCSLSLTALQYWIKELEYSLDLHDHISLDYFRADAEQFVLHIYIHEWNNEEMTRVRKMLAWPTLKKPKS